VWEVISLAPKQSSYAFHNHTAKALGDSHPCVPLNVFFLPDNSAALPSAPRVVVSRLSLFHNKHSLLFFSSAPPQLNDCLRLCASSLQCSRCSSFLLLYVRCLRLFVRLSRPRGRPPPFLHARSLRSRLRHLSYVTVAVDPLPRSTLVARLSPLPSAASVVCLLSRPSSSSASVSARSPP
jgi:hypothetical protein